MAHPRANNEASAAPTADRGDPEAAYDESTPLLVRDATDPTSRPAGGVQDNSPRWLRKGWITYIACFLVALVFILTLILGGTIISTSSYWSALSNISACAQYSDLTRCYPPMPSA